MKYVKGQRIRVVKNGGVLRKGETGTVVDIESSGFPGHTVLRIRFDGRSEDMGDSLISLSAWDGYFEEINQPPLNHAYVTHRTYTGQYCAMCGKPAIEHHKAEQRPTK